MRTNQNPDHNELHILYKAEKRFFGRGNSIESKSVNQKDWQLLVTLHVVRNYIF